MRVYLEQRVEELEELVKTLSDRVFQLENERPMDILTIPQAAERLNCSVSTVRRRIDAGQLKTLPGYKSRVVLKNLAN